jgi:hypothetical protein
VTQDALGMFTVYDRPKDFPHSVVVRRFWSWSILWPNGVRRAARHHDPEIRGFFDLEAARNWCESQGLYRLPRQPGDDPKIVETWI